MIFANRKLYHLIDPATSQSKIFPLCCRMADAGNHNSKSVQNFIRSVLNAVRSLQSNAENADRSRETTNSDRFTSVESEINSRFQIPRRRAGAERCQVQLPELFRRPISTQDRTVVRSKLLAGGTPEVENGVKRG